MIQQLVVRQFRNSCEVVQLVVEFEISFITLFSLTTFRTRSIIVTAHFRRHLIVELFRIEHTYVNSVSALGRFL